MAAPWPAKPNETSFTPAYSQGVIARVSGFISISGVSGLTIMGSEGPYTSASKMPTFAPIIASVYARLTDVVDLPTPPLHDETAMTWRTSFRPGSATVAVSGAASGAAGCAEKVTSTSVTHPSAPTAALLSCSNCALTGHAGVVSSSSKLTSPPSATWRFFTNPHATTDMPKSGSITASSALSTCASLDPPPCVPSSPARLRVAVSARGTPLPGRRAAPRPCIATAGDIAIAVAIKKAR